VKQSFKTNSVKSFPGIFVLVFIATCAYADETPEVQNTQEGTPLSAQEAAGQMTVPNGFHVTLFAGEPDVQQPISITTDERGRLWVAENYTYAEYPANFDMTRNDRIVILEDTDGDGKFDVRKVFWDQAKRLTSVEVGHGGVWALCAPQMLFIPDRDGDDVPDGPAEVVLDGWDAGPVRHNIVNGLKWGPDGWLYGRHGIQATSLVGKPGSTPSQRVKLNCSIWRYHPTQKTFETVAHGTTNSWGFDYDDHGQMFFINTVIGHLWHLVPGAHYRRMYGADFNPHLYQLIEQCADHLHWDTGEKWNDIRKGVSDTTAQAGGGHAHSGLMIYLGDNWPSRYRNSMFTLNFHGRRINHDRLVRTHAGYVGQHADDVLFANNEWFRGLDLIYGSDGGVFVADWSDIGECHENDGVHRTSGRIYKVTYGRPEQTVALDLGKLSDRELVTLQTHANDWYVRQARRLLHERSISGRDMSRARQALFDLYRESSEATRQLRALWCLNLIGAADETWLRQQLGHENEHVRLWTIRLLADAGQFESETLARFAEMARTEPSGLVRLYLASAMQRLPLDARWPVANGLASHSEDAADKALPLMIWYGIEPAVPIDPQQAVELVSRSKIPLVRRHVARRLTNDLESDPQPAEELLKLIGTRNDPEFQLDLLRGMNQALRGWRKAPTPRSWARAAEIVFSASPEPVKKEARQLGVVFGDGRAIAELQRIVVNGEADVVSRRGALRTLVDEKTDKVLPLLKKLLGDRALTNEVLRGFAAFDDPAIPGLILGRYGALDPAGRAVVVDTLSSRPTFARELLKAVDSGQIDRAAITAYHARQMRGFGDETVDRELTRLWGSIRKTTAEKKQRITQLKSLLDSDEVAQANLSHGRRLFDKSCSNCHVLYGVGGRIGPDLTGSNRHNLTYLLENIVDPSASVNQQFKVSVIALEDGRVVTGVLVAITDRTLTVQTQKERLVLNRTDVDEVVQQDVSLMPDGLLKQLSDEQIRDLFAYLASRSQVPVSAAE